MLAVSARFMCEDSHIKRINSHGRFGNGAALGKCFLTRIPPPPMIPAWFTPKLKDAVPKSNDFFVDLAEKKGHLK